MALQLVVAAALAIGSLVAGEEARSEQRKASRLQRRLQERQNQRERLQQVREANIERARIRASAANAGTAESSGVQGGIAAVQQSAASNISFINQADNLQQGIASANRRAQDAAGASQALGQAASLAASFSPAPAPTTTAGTPTTG